MIIKYGTSEPANVVETKNIPSWIGATTPVANKISSEEGGLPHPEEDDLESDQEEE